MYEYGTLLKATTLHFKKKWPQARVAKELSVSPPTLSRMINEAIDRGIVRIEIVDIQRAYKELERRLIAQFGLDDAVVVESSKSADERYLKTILGKAGADYLLKVLKPATKIGIGPGETIFELIESLDSPHIMAGNVVVPLIGGWSTGGIEYEVNKLTEIGRAHV